MKARSIVYDLLSLSRIIFFNQWPACTFTIYSNNFKLLYIVSQKDMTAIIYLKDF